MYRCLFWEVEHLLGGVTFQKKNIKGVTVIQRLAKVYQATSQGVPGRSFAQQVKRMSPVTKVRSVLGDTTPDSANLLPSMPGL